MIFHKLRTKVLYTTEIKKPHLLLPCYNSHQVDVLQNSCGYLYHPKSQIWNYTLKTTSLAII